MSNSINTKPITLGEVVIAFPSLFEPSKAPNATGDPKYNTGLLLTKEQYDNQVKPELDSLIAQVFKDGEADNPQFKWPFYECKHKAKTYPGGAAAGMYYGNAKSQYQGQVVDAARAPILDPGKIKDGARAYISVHFYSFTTGSNGIGCGLGPVMYVGDGEALNTSGGATADEAFAGIEVDTTVAPTPPPAGNTPPPPPGA